MRMLNLIRIQWGPVSGRDETPSPMQGGPRNARQYRRSKCKEKKMDSGGWQIQRPRRVVSKDAVADEESLVFKLESLEGLGLTST